ncbi:MAG TPA: 1-deoxy-D-xylulose-5-phosphate reductoisomerase, partial [Clostridiales bacterium]|nr:1-deoxy-D-xylulose-5-phosphate reductoisomerase [Clostridiales bacterium]
IIHSAVEFIDGSIMAQMGTPDMRLPIQYALYYPKRKDLSGERIDFFKLAKLDFEKPDNETFPALELAYKVGKAGGSLPTVFNAANEIAVEKFLNGKIRYLEIVELITSAIEAHSIIPNPTVSQILEIEEKTHEYINCFVK